MNINKIIAEELQHFNEELYNDEYKSEKIEMNEDI